MSLSSCRVGKRNLFDCDSFCALWGFLDQSWERKNNHKYQVTQWRILFEVGMVEIIMLPLTIMESKARQQFVHLHLWTAGLVTITGPGKKTLQSHYNNDSNSGQDRHSLCVPLSFFSVLHLFLFPPTTSVLVFDFCLFSTFCLLFNIVICVT